ncbi:MAG: trypsin-like peptidase domain-containing protein [Cyclobacteriaceae bacterium]|nr:trypsin-like peptidase domain-containing protein [Cyclobacteriaceae bacterium]MCB9238983.1 trypsin-like peptidase domain-containing protein [Flammeovirgaceae bacterium]MCB0498259.1 trypsin-like peptidase domain-containing protein [Cyclobacteriaceae bacterium]MCO5270706.1 trypsin-like peptidase domain-containing protein [Cyclobacteriaceae bacterium]MCW5900857.1 trypsin-like peptidase domain-containing protein [Cyclobacteriaceae bacterium]
MNTLKTIVIGFLAGVAGAYTFFTYQVEGNRSLQPEDGQFNIASYQPEDTYRPTIVSPRENASMDEVDFSTAAKMAIPSVVYINSISQGGVSYSYWDMLFNGRSQTQVSSGSGVIFTSDGYIVTNNHVVESAEKIQVIYNKKVYDAELIGTDPSTDLAVLKIQETNLPAITLGNSTNLAVGEWVLAVGNPFSLSSTVTAGIVSAKGRRINIVDDKFPIESFIQTDAAINPGNSGGALVNKNGELVGINTAILSRTGSYTGYAFAVPIDIAKKVVGDLVKYGIVQKPFFGGNVVEYDFQNAKKYNLKTDVKEFNGVLLAEMDRQGPAINAGLNLGDIIVKMGDVEINSKSGFEEELSHHSPGDKIRVLYLRDGKMNSTDLVLVNRDGDTSLIKRKFYSDATLGATLEAVEYGVKVFKIKDGLFKRIEIPENYTIISINRQRVRDPQEVIEFFNKYKGRVVIYGVTSAKQELPLSFYLQ